MTDVTFPASTIRLRTQPSLVRKPRHFFGLVARVPFGPDDAHAAVAEFGADRVRAERGAWREGHG